MEIKLSEKRALVTGGSSGIGAAIALALAQAGAKVAINYLTHPEMAAGMAQQVEASHSQALTLQGDVSNPDEVEKMYDQMDQAWGGVDVLINSAGIDGSRQMGWEADLKSWRQVMEVNLFGAFYCCRQALKRMIAQKSGVILSISSVHEIIAWSGYSAYTASKAALGSLTKTLAQEAAPYGVRVLALGPGAVETPINRSVWADPKGLEDLLDKIPMKRMGKPDEIAKMAVVLVSDAASYMTGRTIFVDGGMTDYANFAHGG